MAVVTNFRMIGKRPDTQTIAWDFAEGKTMSWEGRSCNDFPVEGRARGAMIYGTDGAALLDGDDYIIYDRHNKIVKQAKGTEVVDPTNPVSGSGVEMDTAHVSNFIESVRAGQQLNCPIAEGYKSVTALLLGNIAWRVGRELRCDPANGRILHDQDAMKLWRREYESLAGSRRSDTAPRTVAFKHEKIISFGHGNPADHWRVGAGESGHHFRGQAGLAIGHSFLFIQDFSDFSGDRHGQRAGRQVHEHLG